MLERGDGIEPDRADIDHGQLGAHVAIERVNADPEDLCCLPSLKGETRRMAVFDGS